MTIPVTPAVTAAALDRWLKGPEWRNSIFADRDRTDMRAALTAALAASVVDEVVEALQNLVNEVSGAWNAFEGGIRSEIGNTNYQCVAVGIESARAALAKVAQP